MEVVQYDEIEFSGVIIRQRKQDGYLNATDMCKANKKLYGNWYQLDSTKEYLKELSEDIGYPITELIQVKRGGNSKQQGTWIHPYIATNLAQWLSPKFAVFVSKLVYRYVSGDITLIDEIKKNNKALQEQLKAKDKMIEENKNQLDEQNKVIEENKNKLIKLNEFVQVAHTLKKDEVFYIATTELYAKNNRFKYGGVSKKSDLVSRLASYNTGRAEKDLYYYCRIIECNRYKHIENCLDMLIKGFKDKLYSKKEMVHMRYDCFVELIEFIAENHDKEIEFINDHAKKYIEDTINLEPIIPKPIDLSNSIVVSRRRNGRETELQKIDVSNWKEAKVQELIKTMINQYAQTKLNTEYNFDAHKDNLALRIVWKDFKEFFDQYRGKNITNWKQHIKNILTGSNLLSIKWR